MHIRTRPRAAPFAVLALAVLFAPEWAIARSFDYLHVEANSGASSGGHAAIRFDEDTYHFLNADPGIVQAVREASGAFEFTYRAYDNRAIDVTRVEVSDHTYRALRDAFVRRVLVEDAQLELLDSARRDESLLDALATWPPPRSPRAWRAPRITLKGAGYFYDGDGYAATAPFATTLRRVGVATLGQLRAEVERELGPGWIADEAARLDREIAGLRYSCAPTPRLEPDRLPATGADFADRYADLLLARLAIDVLETSRAPVARGFRTSARPLFGLDAQQLQAMRARSARTRAGIRTLLTSHRPDRGFPLLVAMARLVAMDTSVALRRLVVLDTFADDQDALTAAQLTSDASAVGAVLEEKRAELERETRNALRAAPDNEIAWTQLELAANFYLELEDGLTTGVSIRVDAAPVPSRSVTVDSAWPHPRTDPATVTAWRTCAAEVAEATQAEIKRLYAYDLVSRNCVTEIFATIDDAFAQPPGSGRSIAAERAALGGRVAGERGLNFVPFVSAHAANQAYRVKERIRLPSYRHYWLARMLREQGDPIGVRLRESNTLTSRLYQSGSSDVFLFFTDDTPVVRPILGAANVIVATGAAAAGLLALPFDRGKLAVGGLSGMIFSLPELAFVNIRKGANTLVPRDWTQTPAFDTEYTAARVQ